MKVTAVLDELYVPKWNGNRDLPEADQVTVRIKWPTNEERERLKGYKLNPRSEEVAIYFDTPKILRDHIGEIANLEVTYNGKPVKITSGTTLAASKVLALGGLIDELKGYVCSEEGLTEETEKN